MSVLLSVNAIHYLCRDRTKILDDISFNMQHGEIIALFGPNGAGKSTLLKLISGILPLRGPGCSGQVQYLNQDLLSLPHALRAQKIVYVGADFKTEFPITAEESVFLGKICQKKCFLWKISQKDRDLVRWAMDICGCWHLRSRNLASLSSGERQLVALARALTQGSRILLLDEALSRMDLNHQDLIGKMLKHLAQQGWSILIVSHDVNLATEWADSGILLKKGKKVFQGKIREVMTTDKMKILYPDTHFIQGSHPITQSPKVFFGSA